MQQILEEKQSVATLFPLKNAESLLNLVLVEIKEFENKFLKEKCDEKFVSFFKNECQWKNMESTLDLICVGFFELFTQVSTFAIADEEQFYKELFVEIGVLEAASDCLYTLKLIVDRLEQLKIFEPQKLKKGKDEFVSENDFKLDTHPFAGFNSKVVALLCSLTYRKNKKTEQYFVSVDGKLRLGVLLNYSKMDVDNPTLREWCLVVIRNLCSWSDAIREDLKKL